MHPPTSIDSPSSNHSENALSQLIANRIEGLNRLDTSIKGLCLHRWAQPTPPTSYTMPASICFVGSGKKRVFLGEDAFVFDANSFLITSVDLPVVAQVLEASEDTPYLGATLELDIRAISELIIDMPESASQRSNQRTAAAVGELRESLLDAFERLVALANTPEDVTVLAPLIKQEIFYRLLKSDQGPRIREIVSHGSANNQIARVIEWLHLNFAKPIKIEELAQLAGLSVSAFHNHFRALTSMTPLQFLKRVRLNEARRLMLANHADASTAAYQVGYESPSQFSREYSRLFGLPPLRDIKQLTAELEA